ncbi:hypothetical protein Sjap_014090 [Stephania japonica]|uniref:MENTAL domain-containing protein n=1 Tax=Stephania japonica TaxID=461633 RepID=A0AAP0J0Z8_9MAGN
MGLSKVERPRRVMRGLKTLFFIITMFASLLIFSAPILLIIADTILPSAILSAFNASLSLQSLSAHIRNYKFESSLIDIPLISIVRSAIILCVYCLCDGPKLSSWPYLGITTMCSVSSLVYVSLKGSYVFGIHARESVGVRIRPIEIEIALFMSSLVLAVGHVVVAYRTSCRERRKLLIYKIDIEAVSDPIQSNFLNKFFFFLSSVEALFSIHCFCLSKRVSELQQAVEGNEGKIGKEVVDTCHVDGCTRGVRGGRRSRNEASMGSTRLR